jgi:hypothetical protein
MDLVGEKVENTEEKIEVTDRGEGGGQTDDWTEWLGEEMILRRRKDFCGSELRLCLGFSAAFDN